MHSIAPVAADSRNSANSGQPSTIIAKGYIAISVPAGAKVPMLNAAGTAIAAHVQSTIAPSAQAVL